MALDFRASFGDSSHDDDLMTPPTVLLKRASKKAKRLLKEVGVVYGSKEEEGVSDILDTCIRCVALARIVHGDGHWMLAKMHIQLSRVYLQLRALPQQALKHALKAQDILMAPGSPLMSHDATFEVRCQLAMAHCLVGKVHTMQGDLPKAEQEMVKGMKVLVRAKELKGDSEGGATEGMEVEIALLSALGRLHLMQERFEVSREDFVKAIELTRSGVGPTSAHLVPMLRGKATAEARLSLYDAADHTLQEALAVAETNEGEAGEGVAEVLQAQARLAAAQLRAGLPIQPTPAEEKFSRAYSIFSSLKSDKALQCKEEWVLMLASMSDTKKRAIPMLEELVEAKKARFGELDVEVGHSLKLLATVLLSLGKVDQARLCLKQARDAYNCSLGTRHRETVAAIRSLSTISGDECEDSVAQKNQKKPLFKSVF